MKLVVLVAIGTLIIGALSGGYLGGQLGGQGGTVLGMCEVAKLAKAEGMLDDVQLATLGEATGRDIQSNYPAIAKRLSLSDTSRQNAAAGGSECSQFLLNVNIGMESAQ